MIGKSLAHYEVLAKIGEGGMGEVYRAHDTRLGRDVAMKFLPAAAARDPELCERFEREARAIAALQHPNIVTIHSVEELDSLRFITMELVAGQPLSEFLSGSALPLDSFFEIAIPLVDAVGCAHRQGIAHRDLKPANIMVIDGRRPKVLDFGLAKLCEPSDQSVEETVRLDSALTQAGRIIGTIAYMSPEQVRGGVVDARSDLFSLGILFHEMLAGERPFRGAYPTEIMHKIVVEEAPRLAGRPDALVDIVERCLRKTPGDRFASADALLAALREVATNDATTIDMVGGEPASTAWAAFERQDWEAAHREFRAIGERRDLSPEELEGLGTCAAWLCRFDENSQSWERACSAYAKSGDNAAAARMAVELAGLYTEKNAITVAGGWQKRAERLLEDEPDCIVHGLLARRQTIAALGRQDFTEALELNRRCSELAERFQDVDLQAVARHDHGQILVARGDAQEGIELIDEAMSSAVSGEVGPWTMGLLYCRTMVVCRSLADFKRSQEWSELAWRWCEPHGDMAAGYPGICRVHSAETMRHMGLWAEAESAVRGACATFERSGLDGHTGGAYNELGELALRKGDYPAAEEAFQRAHSFGCDPVPGLPLLRLAQGNQEAALRMIGRALDEAPDDRLHRAKLLVAAIPIAMSNDDRSAAESASTELEEIAGDYDSPCFRAHALMGRGTVAVDAGDWGSATISLREAWSIFKELGFSYDAAQARMHLARAYLGAGNDEDAVMQLSAACDTFRDLGAEPDRLRASELIELHRG